MPSFCLHRFPPYAPEGWAPSTSVGIVDLFVAYTVDLASFSEVLFFSSSGFHTYVCMYHVKVVVFTGSHASTWVVLFSSAFSPSFSVNFLLNVGVAPIPFLALVAYYGVFFAFFFFCRASLRAFLPSCVSSFFFVANAAFRCVTSCLALFFCLVFLFFLLLYPLHILHFSASHVLRNLPPFCFFCHAACFSFSFLRPFHVLAHRACLSL